MTRRSRAKPWNARPVTPVIGPVLGPVLPAAVESRNFTSMLLGEKHFTVEEYIWRPGVGDAARVRFDDGSGAYVSVEDLTQEEREHGGGKRREE